MSWQTRVLVPFSQFDFGQPHTTEHFDLMCSNHLGSRYLTKGTGHSIHLVRSDNVVAREWVRANREAHDAARIIEAHGDNIGQAYQVDCKCGADALVVVWASACGACLDTEPHRHLLKKTGSDHS